MKLKKFIKPLVTVSALSMLLMGCAEDSSNSGGSTTPPTAESVFSNFLAGFQSAPAKNAEALEFTTSTATKQTLKVAQGEEVQYLVSLDNVMATYYATFGITGTSTLLTGEGSDLSSSGLTKITHYAKVDTNAEASIDLALTNDTNSLYTGMFALMSQENVEALDTALGELDKEIEAAKPTEGEVTTPDLTKIQAATVQKVVDLINGNMYKVAYNSPAQSVQTAFAAAQPLTLKNGMAFTEGDGGSTFEIAADFSFADATPAVVGEASVVVFLDEFKNILNGMTADAEKDTVKGETDLTTNSDLGITTDTLSSSNTQKKIIYTPAAEVVAGAKVTYIAILDATTDIDSNASAFGTLNGKMTTGATKAEVEAALAELGTIYKIDYTVGTYQSLIDAFKANEAVKAAVAGATKLESLTYTDSAVDYDNTKYLYCLHETGSIKLSTFGGKDVSTDVIDGYVNGGVGQASGSSPTKQIVFADATSAGTYYAYCSTVLEEEFSPSGTTNYEKLADFLGKLTATEDGLGLQVFSHEKAD